MQQITRKKLGEGVGLTCVSTPKFKRAVLRAALLLPLGGADAAQRAALPHVLRRGTVTLPDLRAIGQTLDELYGARIEVSVRKEGETLVIGFLSDVIDERFARGAEGLTGKVVRLLCELLYNPYVRDGAFSPDYVAGERANLLDRIAAQKNDPRAWAPKRLTEIMCEGELYGQSALGTTEQAERITEKKLYAAYQRALDEAHIELFYCGGMQADAVEALFAASLPARRADKLAQLGTKVIASPKQDAPREVTEELPLTQGKLSLGFRTGGNCLTGGDPIAFFMFASIFGGSTNAKLFMNVREKLSLCYYASAQFISLKGIMLVNSGIENDKFEIARDEILRQFEACQKGDISEMEMESARKTLTGAYQSMLDEPIQLEQYWLAQAVADTLQPPEERIAELKKVTRERVIAAAQQAALDTVYFLKGAAQ